MNEKATLLIRAQLLEIIGAVGAVRDDAANFELDDARYLDRELDVIQAATHRLLEFLDNIEQRN